MPKLQIACNTAVDGRHGRPDARATRPSRPTAPRSSSCSSTIPSTARCATRPASATCRTSTWSTASTTRRSSPRRRSRSARWWTSGRSCSTPSAACCARAASASRRNVTGTNSFEFRNRGDHTQIATFEDRPITHNYAGNLADVCPVGALLSHDFRFKMRVWFLEGTESVCPGLLDRLQHLRRPSRRRGAPPAPAAQRRGQQVLDVRHRARRVQGDRAGHARDRGARASAPTAWAGAVASATALDRVAESASWPRPAAPRSWPRPRPPTRTCTCSACSPSARAACSTSASATRRTSAQVREDNVLLRADRNPNTTGCLDLGIGRVRRGRDPHRLRSGAGQGRSCCRAPELLRIRWARRPRPRSRSSPSWPRTSTRRARARARACCPPRCGRRWTARSPTTSGACSGSAARSRAPGRGAAALGAGGGPAHAPRRAAHASSSAREIFAADRARRARRTPASTTALVEAARGRCRSDGPAPQEARA